MRTRIGEILLSWATKSYQYTSEILVSYPEINITKLSPSDWIETQKELAGRIDFAPAIIGYPVPANYRLFRRLK